MSEATCHYVGKSEEADARRARASGRGIGLYIGTALPNQACPHPDPHGASQQRIFIPFLEFEVG